MSIVVQKQGDVIWYMCAVYVIVIPAKIHAYAQVPLSLAYVLRLFI